MNPTENWSQREAYIKNMSPFKLYKTLRLRAYIIKVVQL